VIWQDTLELPSEGSDQFRFLRAASLAHLKGSVGLIFAKTSVIEDLYSPRPTRRVHVTLHSPPSLHSSNFVLVPPPPPTSSAVFLDCSSRSDSESCVSHVLLQSCRLILYTPIFKVHKYWLWSVWSGAGGLGAVCRSLVRPHLCTTTSFDVCLICTRLDWNPTHQTTSPFLSWTTDKVIVNTNMWMSVQWNTSKSLYIYTSIINTPHPYYMTFLDSSEMFIMNR